MKKLIIAAILGVTSMVAFGQGQVQAGAASANAALKFRTSDTLVTYLNNSAYVALYWATDYATLQSGGGTLATEVSPGVAVAGVAGVPGATILNAAGFINATATYGQYRYTSDTRAGVPTYFQLRAWSSAGATSWEAAQTTAGEYTTKTDPTAGGSPIIVASPSSAGPPPGTPTAILWAPGSTTSSPLFINLYPVPEPSTFALAGLGLFGLYFIRRRK